MAEQEVLEGFLCPLCMKDLGDVIQLQVHFEESHAKEDQAFVQSLKDLFFGKVRKKLIDVENEMNDSVTPLKFQKSSNPFHPVSGVRLELLEAQIEAPSRNHFQELRKIRSSRVDRYSVETNRLIVRMDKLLANIPQEASKRREHEQQVVPWISGDLVALCPSCARAFNLARRKHHCRLCGSVLCQECSAFVEFNFCRKLINPVTISSFKPVERPGGGREKFDSKSVGSVARPLNFKLRRSGSRESLNSVMSIVEGKNKEEFRCCAYCKSLLTRRDNMIELQTNKPIVSQFYDSLRTYMLSGEELSPKYVDMHTSLTKGETTYRVDDAKLLRIKLLKIAENIDLMSKKISSLGSENQDENSPLPRTMLLQSQIRRASVNFIKETLVGLPSLPSDDELKMRQEELKKETERKIEEERRRAEEARLKFQILQEKKKSETPPRHERSNGQRFNQSNFSYETGFVLSSSAHAHVMNSLSEDPMIQQMNIIRGFIRDARQANRFDEVQLLEKNLEDLQEEFKKQHPEPLLKSPEDTQSPDMNDSGYVSFKRPEPRLLFDEGRKELVENGSSQTNQSNSGSNPFGEESDDEYDASGKNPFAE